MKKRTEDNIHSVNIESLADNWILCQLAKPNVGNLSFVYLSDHAPIDCNNFDSKFILSYKRVNSKINPNLWHSCNNDTMHHYNSEDENIHLYVFFHHGPLYLHFQNILNLKQNIISDCDTHNGFRFWLVCADNLECLTPVQAFFCRGSGQSAHKYEVTITESESSLLQLVQSQENGAKLDTLFWPEQNKLKSQRIEIDFRQKESNWAIRKHWDFDCSIEPESLATSYDLLLKLDDGKLQHRLRKK